MVRPTIETQIIVINEQIKQLELDQHWILSNPLNYSRDFNGSRCLNSSGEKELDENTKEIKSLKTLKSNLYRFL